MSFLYTSVSSVSSFPYLDFFQMIHSMASHYQPIEGKKAFQCMFESAYAMIPDNESHKTVLYEALIQYPLEGNVLNSSESLLQWSYRVNSHIHRQMYNSMYTPYDQFKKKYDSMTITTWSHPTWKMIHYFASKYDGSGKYALSYKAYVSCLQFLLPCPKCKQHLKDNLANHPIDQYFSSATDLFTWSYILHQTVSSQTGKKGINIQEARRMYGL